MKSRLLIAALLLGTSHLAVASDPPDDAAAAESLARSQAELRSAQDELNALSQRITDLSMRIAKDDIEAALARPAFDRPVIGLVLRPDPTAGASIAGVTPKSSAERAGLRNGDQLLSVDGAAIGVGSPQQRLDRALERLGQLEDGQTLRLDYLRGKQRASAEVTAERLPGLAWWRENGADADAIRRKLEPLIALRQTFDIERLSALSPCLGGSGDCAELRLADALRWRALRLATVDAQLGRYFSTKRGVLVISNEQSALKGLESGDVLLNIGDSEINEPADVLRAVRESAVGQAVPVIIMREGKSRQLELEVAALPPFPGFAPPAPPRPPAPAAPPEPLSPPSPPAPPSGIGSAPSMPAPPAPPANPAPAPSRGVLQQVLR